MCERLGGMCHVHVGGRQAQDALWCLMCLVLGGIPWNFRERGNYSLAPLSPHLVLNPGKELLYLDQLQALRRIHVFTRETYLLNKCWLVRQSLP